MSTIVRLGNRAPEFADQNNLFFLLLLLSPLIICGLNVRVVFITVLIAVNLNHVTLAVKTLMPLLCDSERF